MRTKPFQCILSFLALLGMADGSDTPIAECTAQAWVRAPDLIPNAIIHGDARVKISAECAIEHVSLGLRFKERSFVNALRSREHVKWLNPEPSRSDVSNTSPRALDTSHFANKSVEEAYEEVITNKDLWIVRDEERVVFETTQPIDMGSGGNHGGNRDIVQNFSILVPSTNFPPALDFMRVPMTFLPVMEYEVMHAEWIYEYFARMSFTNGTTQEISAGFTAFQPRYDPASISQGPTKATAELNSWDDTGGNTANYSIEISAESGLTFFAGAKSHVVTAVVTRTGLARTFSAPLSVLGCVIPNSSSKWAAEYDMSDVNARFDSPTSILRATSDSSKQGQINMWHPGCFRQRQLNGGVTVIMPNSTSDEIRANEIVTTTSARFTISIDVDNTHIPTFETYYQTLANSLTITLEVPQEEDVDPEDPSGEQDFDLDLDFDFDFDFGWGPQFEDDEEAWVPWEKMRMPRIKTWYSYWTRGQVPAEVHPTREGMPLQRCIHASASLSGQVVLSDGTSCEQHSLIHYLEEGARGPIFVDRSAIHELLAEDPAKRELRAPVLAPVVSSPPAGGEPVYGYYHPTNFRKPYIYVGATWANKVVDKDRYQTDAPHPNV